MLASRHGFPPLLFDHENRSHRSDDSPSAD
jgi:hypothetical protein